MSGNIQLNLARNIQKNTTIKVDAHDIPCYKPAKSFLEQMKSGK